VQCFKLPSKPALVVASDVHISDPADDRYHLLCQLVEEAIRTRAQAFILNGDIFDFFFGWRSYFKHKYSKLLGLLDQLAANGSKVWFVEGNHEYALEGLIGHFRFQIVSSDGGIIASPDGKRILIAHGDLLSPDRNYRIFRGIVRSQFINFCAFLFPQKLLDRITLWLARTSRSKDKYRELNHDKIRAMATGKLREQCADVIIFGHFHHPYDEVLTDNGRLLSVNSWDEPSCIVVSQTGDIERVYPVF
jgi:UDP-2,3-diacylglucosamine hydrolase